MATGRRPRARCVALLRAALPSSVGRGGQWHVQTAGCFTSTPLLSDWCAQVSTWKLLCLWGTCWGWCVVPSSPAEVVTCHASQPADGEHVGWAPHTWSLCVVQLLPSVELRSDLCATRGGRRSAAAPIAEGTAAHQPSQAGGTAAIIPSPPPVRCLDEQRMTWGLKSAAGKSLTWLFFFFFLKGRQGSRPWLCSHFRSFCPPWKASPCAVSASG